MASPNSDNFGAGPLSLAVEKELDGDIHSHLQRCAEFVHAFRLALALLGRLSGMGQNEVCHGNFSRTRIVLAGRRIYIVDSFLSVTIARNSLCSLILGLNDLIWWRLIEVEREGVGGREGHCFHYCFSTVPTMDSLVVAGFVNGGCSP